ncbi:MAG: hypothetical protein CTY30_07545, partial [Methylocystis sp.]
MRPVSKFLIIALLPLAGGWARAADLNDYPT